jgi:hypothetical protein
MNSVSAQENWVFNMLLILMMEHSRLENDERLKTVDWLMPHERASELPTLQKAVEQGMP